MQVLVVKLFFFFFQAEDGIRDHCVTGVQTCALPILVIDMAVFGERASTVEVLLSIVPMVAVAPRLREGTHQLERHIADERRTSRGFAVADERREDRALTALWCGQHLRIAIVPGFGKMELPTALVRVREDLPREITRQGLATRGCNRRLQIGC